jgi:hypothetical protein
MMQFMASSTPSALGNTWETSESHDAANLHALSRFVPNSFGAGTLLTSGVNLPNFQPHGKYSMASATCIFISINITQHERVGSLRRRSSVAAIRCPLVLLCP